MSLLGLSLAIGILIDDAIVVRENIVRHVEMGKDHYTAAHEGTDEIGLAVAATTFSIVVVFVPIAFMGGDRRAVVRAVRADHRLLGAGVAVRVVLARPDAVGLLARSARAAGAARLHHALARPVQRTGSIARPSATRRSSAGRSTTAGDGRARGRVVRRRARAAGARHRRRRVLPGDRRVGVQHRARDAAGLEPRVHAAEGRGSGAHRARRSRRWSTPTRRSAAQTGAVDEGTVYVRAEAEARARAQPGDDRGAELRERAGAARRRDRVDHDSGFGDHEADPAPARGRDSRELQQARRAAC